MVQKRRHTAIMFTDIVGYTKLMGADESKALDSKSSIIKTNILHNF
jgi:class 3 adenylate cyclase